MSDKPKGTDAIQAEIAKEFRNFKASPGLEIGLRPELGTFELCDKHYDASKTESPEHCAVCSLQARVEALEEQNKRLIDGYREAIDDIEDWAAYAGDYFQEKHDLDGCIAAHKELLIMLGPLLCGRDK